MIVLRERETKQTTSRQVQKKNRPPLSPLINPGPTKKKSKQAASIGNSAAPPLAVPQSALEFLKMLSQGPNSTVRAALLSPSLSSKDEEEGNKNSERVAVAVKRVALRRPSDGAAFRAEVAALARISATATPEAGPEEEQEEDRRKRVSTLVGARALPPDFLILTPLCARGSVAAALQKKSLTTMDNRGSNDDKNGLGSWPGILRLAGDIAQGIAAVHAAGLVHRDVKPENVLLGEKKEFSPFSLSLFFF